MPVPQFPTGPQLTQAVNDPMFEEYGSSLNRLAEYDEWFQREVETV